LILDWRASRFLGPVVPGRAHPRSRAPAGRLLRPLTGATRAWRCPTGTRGSPRRQGRTEWR